MKKLLFGTMLLALVIVFYIPTMARAGVNVSITLPPPIVFAAPPDVILLPETYVYVDPDIDADLFFYNGWWWRLWEGRWYRSQNYNSGWGYSIKAFHLFMQGYPQAGGMTTGIIVGEDIHGTTSEYLTRTFNGTGATGKRASIGRSSKLGVSKV